MIIKLQNGDKLKIGSDEEARRKYKEHSQLSMGQKLKRNLNIASNFLKSGPNITNFGNAVSALFGGYSPENPDVIKGDPPGVGIKNFENLVKTVRVAREFNDVLSKAPKTKEFIMPGLVEWAPKTKFKGYHASNENPFVPDFFKEGWAQKTHNAVKGIYIANGKVPGYGFLTKRKYVHPVETTFEKPQIQLGEVKGRTKNGIRNQIERDAQEQGADGIIFKGISDNQMQNQFIAKTLNPDTKILNGPVNIFQKSSKNDIVRTSQNYSMKDSKGIDLLKQFFAQQKIQGKEYTLEGLKDATNVQRGLPEYIQSYLNQNTVERVVRAMRKDGYSEREIQQYADKVNEIMNKVKVGMYSDQEYNAAGAQNFGGFYNNNQNFISVNKDAYLRKPSLTPNYILKHEGRHLIDYNTSMTDDVTNILEKAYDKDFLEIPKHKDVGNLKDYQHMDRERVTTNRDARDILLSNLEKLPGEFQNQTKFIKTSFGKNKNMVDFQNELIQYAEPEEIINAVENSNGYGKAYINYLRSNSKLTPEKINQFKQSMIHVGNYISPIIGGTILNQLFNRKEEKK